MEVPPLGFPQWNNWYGPPKGVHTQIPPASLVNIPLFALCVLTLLFFFFLFVFCFLLWESQILFFLPLGPLLTLSNPSFLLLVGPKGPPTVPPMEAPFLLLLSLFFSPFPLISHFLLSLIRHSHSLCAPPNFFILSGRSLLSAPKGDLSEHWHKGLVLPRKVSFRCNRWAIPFISHSHPHPTPMGWDLKWRLKWECSVFHIPIPSHPHPGIEMGMAQRARPVGPIPLTPRKMGRAQRYN